MSRNVRQKQPRTPVKARQRRGSDSSSSLNLSDDEGYSGVEDVSESDDDDEEHVVAAEEEHIITDATRKRPLGPPRPVEDDDGDADEENDDEDDDSTEDDDDGGENDESNQDNDPADDGTSWEGFSTEPEDTNPIAQVQQIAVTERRVRFHGIPDSDSDDTTSETDDIADFFPDIFVNQASLDPAFRREIEQDDDSETSGSFWDFQNSSQDLLHQESEEEMYGPNDVTPTVTPRASVAPADLPTPIAEERQELDGYETDGDTTEDEMPEPIVRKKTRRPYSQEPTSESETERPRQRGKPRRGPFSLDHPDEKPIAVLNPTTRRVVIFTPQKARALDLAPESFHLDLGAMGRVESTNLSPILNNNPAHIMMGAMVSSNTFGDFMNSQPFGPCEAFFPSGLLSGSDSDDSDYVSQADQEDDGEELLCIEDFIQLHPDSEEEGGDEEEATGAWGDDVESSPSRPMTAASGTSTAPDSASAVHPLLNHFNNTDVVGAFRRNQINQQLILSSKATRDSLAFSGPYYHGTLRGIKSDRMEMVTTPITPVRRRRGNSMVGANGLVPELESSPLNSALQKRKASGSQADERPHKRHQSISDMSALQL